MADCQRCGSFVAAPKFLFMLNKFTLTKRDIQQKYVSL